MALAPFGVLDLSAITDEVIALLDTGITNSPLWSPSPSFSYKVTGLAPDENKGMEDCLLHFYLYHVSEDRFNRTLEVEGKADPASPLRYSPLALDLRFLLTARAKKSYVYEQQLMSVALRCLHDNPIFPLSKPPVYLTVEPESDNELSRLWQSFTVPLRLGAIYRASVVLITPEQVVAPPAKAPKRVSVDAFASLPGSSGGVALGTVRTLAFTKPNGQPADPVDLSPAVSAPGPDGVFAFYYTTSLAPAAQRIWLRPPVGPDVDVTAWLKQPIGPGDDKKRFRADLVLPATIGSPPAASPKPGVYQLAVGDASGAQSSATPFSIAPRVDVTLSPPLLPMPGGKGTITGAGFTTGETEVLLDAVRLVPGALAAGKFTINGGENQITFMPPATGMHAGLHLLRVRSGGVEATPSWWVST